LAHFVRLTRAERPWKVRWTFRSEEPGGALAFSMRIQRLGLAHFVRLTHHPPGQGSCGDASSGYSGTGWVLEVSCPNGNNSTNYFKSTDIASSSATEGCEDCESGPSGGVGVNTLGIINSLDNLCARLVFKKLKTGLFDDDPIKPEIQVPGSNIDLNLSQLILQIFNESKFINYSISNNSEFDVDSNGNYANARTQGAATTLNNEYLKTATELSIARTMIHELVHAYLNLRVSNTMIFEDGFGFIAKMEEFAKANGISDLNSNKFHHEFMGGYVKAMAYSLYEWDKLYGTGGNLGWDYYYKMATAGLSYKNEEGEYVFADSFFELFPKNSDRDDALKIHQNEKAGNKDAKGTKCD